MTSIADSSILTSGLVSARGSGAQRATRAYWEGNRRGVDTCSTSSAPRGWGRQGPAP